MSESLPPSTQQKITQINEVIIASENKSLHNAKKKTMLNMIWTERDLYANNQETAQKISFETRKKYLQAIDLTIEEVNS